MVGFSYRAITEHGRTLPAKVDGLHGEMNARFEAVNEGFAFVQKQFAQAERHVDGQFEAVNQRFDGVDRRLGRLETQFEGLATRVATLDRDVKALSIKVEGRDRPLEE